MLRKIFLSVLAIVLVLTGATYVAYRIWLADTIERIESGSRVAHTTNGDIEYAVWGDTGPAILFLHGSPGGYDQAGPMGPVAQARGYRARSQPITHTSPTFVLVCSVRISRNIGRKISRLGELSPFLSAL